MNCELPRWHIVDLFYFILLFNSAWLFGDYFLCLKTLFLSLNIVWPRSLLQTLHKFKFAWPFFEILIQIVFKFIIWYLLAYHFTSQGGTTVSEWQILFLEERNTLVLQLSPLVKELNSTAVQLHCKKIPNTTAYTTFCNSATSDWGSHDGLLACALTVKHVSQVKKT